MTVKGCGTQSHVEWVLWDIDLDKRCNCGPIIENDDEEEQMNNSDNDDCPSSVLVLTNKGK
jgi:hypothetical protein